MITKRATKAELLREVERLKSENIALIREFHRPCVTSFNARGRKATCAYLKDGTKVVLRREGAAAWLGFEVQDALEPADSASLSASTPTKGEG